MNIYGFSPYILQSYSEQIDDPNINKFIKKKFNYGYTNYIKIQTKSVLPFSSRLHKKLRFKKKNTDKKKALKLIPDFFLVKKEKNKKIQVEDKGNFLKKVLGLMSGYKVNTYNEETHKKKDDNNEVNIEEKTVVNPNVLKRRRGMNNMQLLKDILAVNKKKAKNKSLSFNNIDIFGERTGNNVKLKTKNLKQFFENVQKNMGVNKSDKNVLTLTKNKYILGNKRLFSSISSKNIHSLETTSSVRKRKNLNKFNSIEIPKNLIKENKNQFLLFTKAVPYKYMKYSQTCK